MDILDFKLGKMDWTSYALLAGFGLLVVYHLGVTSQPPPVVSPAQQALAAQDTTLLNQLAQPDTNPLNYVSGTTTAAGMSPTTMLVLGAAAVGLYMMSSGGSSGRRGH